MELFLVLVLSSIVSFSAIRFLIPVAASLSLIDMPSGRKQHAEPTPLIGGIAAYVGVLAAFLVASPLSSESLYFLLGGTIVLIVGMLDDRKPMGVRVRLVAQCFAIGVVISGTGLYVTYLPVPIMGGEFSLGWFGIPFTIIAVIGLMNAFNLADGIDGLSGSLAIVAIVGIFSFASLQNSAVDHSLVLFLAVSLLPYLLHNLGILGRKIFLGDAGSMFVGFVISWTLIAHSETTPPTISSSAALWCVAIPVIDTLGVMVRRIKKGRSPFQPDRDHLHHILQRVGLSSHLSLMVMVGASLVVLAFGLVLETVLPNYALLGFLSLFALYAYCLLHAWRVQRFLSKD